MIHNYTPLPSPALPTDAGDCESVSGWVANGSDSENTEGVEKFRDNALGV